MSIYYFYKTKNIKKDWWFLPTYHFVINNIKYIRSNLYITDVEIQEISEEEFIKNEKLMKKMLNIL